MYRLLRLSNQWWSQQGPLMYQRYWSKNSCSIDSQTPVPGKHASTSESLPPNPIRSWITTTALTYRTWFHVLGWKTHAQMMVALKDHSSSHCFWCAISTRIRQLPMLRRKNHCPQAQWEFLPPGFQFLVQFPVYPFVWRHRAILYRGYPTKMSRLRGISISLFFFQECQEETHTKTMNHWVIPCFLFRPDIHANWLCLAQLTFLSIQNSSWWRSYLELRVI